MNTLFIIPARGGSKGLLYKNLREVGGVSLVGRMVRAARAALGQLEGRGRVVVSTDDQAIADNALAHGAEVPFLRPAELAQDSTPTRPVILHALDWYADRGETFDDIVLLQATAPLTTMEDILGALALFREVQGPPVVAVTEPRDPVDHHFTHAGTLLEPASEHAFIDMRQKRRPEVAMAGSIYICTPTWLREREHWVIPGTTHGYLVPTSHAIDIDDELGLVMNEAVDQYLCPWPPNKLLIIAEAGVNHNGDVEMALQMVEAAAESGADAVKFQALRASEYIAESAPQAAYQARNTGLQISQRELVRQLELTRDEMARVQQRCHECGVMFCASVFDELSLREYDSLHPPFIKLPSGEVTNPPLLIAAARTLRPVMLSTGMSTLAEVAAAVELLRREGTTELSLLHCTSDYPARTEDSNLRAIQRMADAFSVPVGLSDHTIGPHAAIMATALGARIFEKHFTLDRSLPGPDQAASATPAEFRAYVDAIRLSRQAMGTGEKQPVAAESNTAAVARKSLVAATDLPAGHLLTADDLRCKRPGTGLSPMLFDTIVGRRLARPVMADQVLDRADLA